MATTEIDDILPTGQHIAGHHHPAFAAVADAFRANFADRKEVGASVCVTHRGQTVVDLWGGAADAKTGSLWQRDTIGIVFSCTKGATALCAHMLAARGKLALKDEAAKLWPAFAQHGKAGTTIGNMLGHTSPVPHLRATIPRGGMTDYDAMVALLEAEPAWWEPGTRQGYQGLTFAWTVGHIVRLAAGQPLGSFFAEHLAGPLGLDFHIGLPATEEHRVAPMIATDPAEADFSTPFLQAVLTQAGSLPHLFMTNNGGADFNTPAMHAAELGSANGITNARGLAGLYAPLATSDGRLLPADAIPALSRTTAATHKDATLLQPMRFSAGFMTRTDNRPTPGDSLLIGETAFGHVGMGGSLGFADPAMALSFGYTMNRMGAGILLNERGQSLVDAAYLGLQP